MAASRPPPVAEPAALDGVAHRRPAAVDTQRLEDLVDVILDRVHREKEIVRYLLIAQVVGDEPQDFELAWRQRQEVELLTPPPLPAEGREPLEQRMRDARRTGDFAMRHDADGRAQIRRG